MRGFFDEWGARYNGLKRQRTMKDLAPRLKFPRDLFRFLHWIIFRPLALGRYMDSFAPSITSAASMFVRGWHKQPARRSLIFLSLFHCCLIPCGLALGMGLILQSVGRPVNWPGLVFYLILGTAVSTSFSLGFCVVFLPFFGLMAAVLNSGTFEIWHGILFSFVLGLAYGLTPKSLRWGLVGGLVYGLVFALLIDPVSGLAIGAAFLAGYFRLCLYFVEAPLSWVLSVRASKTNADKLWRFHPARWDELVWPPLPGLDRYLRALASQNPQLGQEIAAQVRDSFRQGWALDSNGQDELSL